MILRLSLILLLLLCGCRSESPVWCYHLAAERNASCFAVDDTSIITARHVIGDNKIIRTGGEFYGVKDIEYFGEDGARVIIGKHQLRLLATSNRRPKPGEILYAYGWPALDDGMTVMKCRALEAGFLAPLIHSGMSGGPVIDESGRVIGVISSYTPDVGYSTYELYTRTKIR